LLAVVSFLVYLFLLINTELGTIWGKLVQILE